MALSLFHFPEQDLPRNRNSYAVSCHPELVEVAFIFSSNAFAVVVTGEEFNGISTNVVIPPAIAAFVAVSNPSQSVLPGSLMCTCGSITPAISTLFPRSMTGKSPAGNSSTTSAIIPSLISTTAFLIPSGSYDTITYDGGIKHSQGNES